MYTIIGDFFFGSKLSGLSSNPLSAIPSVFLKLTNSLVPQLNCARCASPLVIFFGALKFASVIQTSGYSSKRDAISVRQLRSVVVFIEEVHTEALCEIHLSAGCNQIRIPIFAVEIDRILAVGRERHVESLLLRDLLSRTIFRVDDVEISHARIVIIRDAIGAIVRSDR